VLGVSSATGAAVCLVRRRGACQPALVTFRFINRLMIDGFACTSKGIRSWDIRTQSVYVDSYSGHTDVVNCLKAHKNRLYSGSDDKTVRVWDIVKVHCIVHRNTCVSYGLLTPELIAGCVSRRPERTRGRCIRSGAHRCRHGNRFHEQCIAIPYGFAGRQRSDSSGVSHGRCSVWRTIDRWQL